MLNFIHEKVPLDASSTWSCLEFLRAIVHGGFFKHEIAEMACIPIEISGEEAMFRKLFMALRE